MNIQEYISSGIVESYVLGLADDIDRAEFERMCAAHPEVRAARDAFEQSLEENITGHVVQPPANLKSKIFSTIDMDKVASTPGYSEGASSAPPAVPPIKAFRPIKGQSADARIGVRETGWQKLVAAAAVILLLFSTALNFYFFNRYRQYKEEFQALVQSQSVLASHNQVLQTRLLDYEKAVEMMKDPDMAIVKMPAIPTSPDPTSATTVYWDTVTKDVYLAVSKLPQPAAGQQYQLWAMVDGKPVDAGVFDIVEGPGMTKMKNIPRAEAFAITLEKKGGSPTPSLDKLYVMGKV